MFASTIKIRSAFFLPIEKILFFGFCDTNSDIGRGPRSVFTNILFTSSKVLDSSGKNNLISNSLLVSLGRMVPILVPVVANFIIAPMD